MRDVHLTINCPKCGTQATAIKCWNMASTKEGAKGPSSEIRIGIFECAKCKHKFRTKVNSEMDSQTKNSDTEDLSSLIEKLVKIKLELNNNLSKLRENLKAIESERSGITFELEELEDAEDRANDLEDEVNELRDELKSLKNLLGFKDDQNNQ